MKKLIACTSFIIIFSISGFTQISKAATEPQILSKDIKTHISHLASDELKGRFTGSPECSTAAVYISNEFKKNGMMPLFNDNYLQSFQFIEKLTPTGNNLASLTIGGDLYSLKPDEDYLVVPFSGNQELKLDLVFAGYGITAVKLNYNDYDSINVEGKAVLVLNGHPEYDKPKSKFEEYSSLRQKTAAARDRGASAIIFVNGYQQNENDELTEFKFDRAGTVNDMAALQVKRYFAELLFQSQGMNFEKHQDEITTAGKSSPFEFKNVSVNIRTELKEVEKTSWNAAGLLEGNDPNLKNEYIVVGAHFDHLGLGGVGSLYTGKEPQIHNGADDNASGTAGVLELAEKFASEKDKLRRSIIFTAFSGEELGLLGSNYFVNHPPVPTSQIVTMINMDMIGRLNSEKQLIVYGTGTSAKWRDLLETKNLYGFQLTFNDGGFGPSDHSSFYGKEIPVLFFFTGTHSDYHKPSDDADKINYSGEEEVLRYIYNIVSAVDSLDSKPLYVNVPPREEGRRMGGSKVYVGTIPDFASSTEGYKISGVNDESPAQKAGLKSGDIIIGFGGKKVTSIYDFMYATQDFAPGDTVEVVVIRDSTEVKFNLELEAR